MDVLKIECGEVYDRIVELVNEKTESYEKCVDFDIWYDYRVDNYLCNVIKITDNHVAYRILYSYNTEADDVRYVACCNVM